MPVNQNPTKPNKFILMNGPFKGLFNSVGAGSIPDGYLSVCKNIEITDYGVLKSVYAPNIYGEPEKAQDKKEGLLIYSPEAAAYNINDPNIVVPPIVSISYPSLRFKELNSIFRQYPKTILTYSKGAAYGTDDSAIAEQRIPAEIAPEDFKTELVKVVSHLDGVFYLDNNGLNCLYDFVDFSDLKQYENDPDYPLMLQERKASVKNAMDAANGYLKDNSDEILQLAQTNVYGYAICSWQGSLFFSMGGLLRWSEPGASALTAEAWNEENNYNCITLGNETIRALFPSQGGLIILTDASSYILYRPSNSSYSIQNLYSGPNLALSVTDEEKFFNSPVCNNGVLAYGSNNKIFFYDGSVPKVISDNLKIDNYFGTFAGMYNNRYWFLCLGGSFHNLTDHATVNKLYAYNINTGFWEEYYITDNLTKEEEVMTCIAGGGTDSLNYRDVLFIGTYTGKVYEWNYAYNNQIRHPTYTLPWEFETKEWLISEQQDSVPYYIDIKYQEQEVNSPITIYLYMDGVKIMTTNFNMLKSGTDATIKYKHIKIVPNEVGTLLKGNAFKLRADSSNFLGIEPGPMEISDIGLEFSPMNKGEINNTR